MEFLDISTGPGEPDRLCRELADLHTRSVSPTGKFGFHVTTFQGPFRQDTTWEDSWAKFFGRLLRLFLSYEMNTNGPSADGKYEAEFKKLLDVTVDRLLGPLQADGRQLKPCLVHGDLWHENVATELDTGQPKIFDAACFYAHNEFELGMWRRPAIKFSRPYFRQYVRNFPPSEPKDQWDDRNRLYCVNFELCQSTAWAGSAESSRKT
jgi:fructosamine-3-kinase